MFRSIWMSVERRQPKKQPPTGSFRRAAALAIKTPNGRVSTPTFQSENQPMWKHPLNGHRGDCSNRGNGRSNLSFFPFAQVLRRHTTLESRNQNVFAVTEWPTIWFGSDGNASWELFCSVFYLVRFVVRFRRQDPRGHICPAASDIAIFPAQNQHFCNFLCSLFFVDNVVCEASSSVSLMLWSSFTVSLHFVSTDA